MKLSVTVRTVVLLFSLFLTIPGFAHKKTIALTIDDLPFVGEYKNFHLRKIIHALEEQDIPATGFVIAAAIRPDNWEVLHQFREAGFDLGNHTFSHANLNKSSLETYILEIEKADTILSPLLTEPKYFRYPYLAMSSGIKKKTVLKYLKDHHYQVAPITIDSKDYLFNQELLAISENCRRMHLDEIKQKYLDFIWQQTLKAETFIAHHRKPDQAQILLVHANLINAYVLPDIIQLYKQNGYTFISLQDALNTM